MLDGSYIRSVSAVTEMPDDLSATAQWNKKREGDTAERT